DDVAAGGATGAETLRDSRTRRKRWPSAALAAFRRWGAGARSQFRAGRRPRETDAGSALGRRTRRGNCRTGFAGPRGAGAIGGVGEETKEGARTAARLGSGKIYGGER